jgi:hypothetical protein
MIKSYRGKLATGTQDQIYIAGGDADTGYKIVKLQLFHTDPGIGAAEHTVKVFSIKQTAVDNVVDFSDETLLAVAHLADHQDVANPLDTIAVFDNEIFNQDIYVTHIDTRGSEACNYYIELEEIKMKDSEAAVINYKAALLHGQ